MSQQNILDRVLKWDYLILLPILALAYYITFIPHLNYPYPLHLDEWTQLAYSNQILEQATAFGLNNPFSGGASTTNQIYEIGSHVPWAVFHQISGIPWMTIFRYAPSIVFVVTVLSVYCLGRRLGFGWEAAFFTCLIPTTVGILGPAFLVPAALGLLYIPLSLFIAHNFKSVWSYAVLLIFSTYLISLHGPTAVIMVITLLPYILLSLKEDFKHSLALMFSLAVPFFITIPWTIGKLLPRATSLLTPVSVATYIDVPRIIVSYGYIPILLCLLGILPLVIRGGPRNYGLVLGLSALALMMAFFFTLNYGVPLLYYRGLTPMLLMVGIVAGAGLMAVRQFRLPTNLTNWVKAPAISQYVGNILCLVLIGVILVIAIPARQSTPYYHMSILCHIMD